MSDNSKICNYITELVNYAVKNGICDELDRTFMINSLMAACGVKEYLAPAEELPERELHLILEDIIDYALEAGVLESDSAANKDLFDTKLMGILTPPPSVVIGTFYALYEDDPKIATDWYYDFSRNTNYIRNDRIAKDMKWTAPTEYGDIDITINLSKPEKDPRDIAAAGKAKSTSYPKCLLCPENEGFEGSLTHPARQNHRIIPVELEGDAYYLQYSPYVYYNEHCIILNKEHIPMKIDKGTFAKLLSFTEKFPHYTAGSNSDIPIVGGSILSHDHFQGGCYEFPMARAEYEEMFTIKGFEDITAGIVKWPMSVIRLQGEDRARVADCADLILNRWIGYNDEDAFITAYTEDGVRHNAITPIARRTSDMRYELDLVLRNNITTDEHPMGVFHPHEEYHHIKKENIGLIEVMGLAVLPARLKSEMSQIADAILNGDDMSSIESIAKHAKWVSEWRGNYELNDREQIEDVLKTEIGKVFAKVLECSGVFKRDEKGREAFRRFTGTLY